MKILITGVAGFIGFNLAKFFLEKKNNIKIIGIDNLDDYYSVKLKKDRIKNIKKFKNFKFIKQDVYNKKSLDSLIKKNKFDFVYHLAAQAGVRYSIKNPQKYYDTNIIGFTNLLEILRKNKVKKIIYASSSSVYGDSKKFPLKENLVLKPKNVYALSKKFNEDLANVYKNLYKINIVGIRFFTVFGEWGRPDMFMLKYLKNIYHKANFELYNKGNHYRDFTYIGDVVKILYLLRNLKTENHDVLNICSNNPVKITKIISQINKITKKNPKIRLVGMQKADILKTHGCNKKIKKLTKIKTFKNINESLLKTINWYMNYYNIHTNK